MLLSDGDFHPIVGAYSQAHIFRTFGAFSISKGTIHFPADQPLPAALVKWQISFDLSLFLRPYSVTGRAIARFR